MKLFLQHFLQYTPEYSDTNTITYGFIYNKIPIFWRSVVVLFLLGQFYCHFYSEKVLDLWPLSKFIFEIVASDTTYLIKRKMKGIRYISTVLHYSSCMKRQSKMAASHAAILHSELFTCFFFLFSWLDVAWINLNKSKLVINWYNFPSVLQKVSFKIAAGLPVHHTMKTSRVVHLMPLSYQTFVLELLTLFCCYFFVQGCFR